MKVLISSWMENHYKIESIVIETILGGKIVYKPISY